jgi:hypothetical protein
VKITAGKIYISRRGERVLVSSVEARGEWPVHFVVLDGRYKGVGQHDGSRLRIDGRAKEPVDGVPVDHWNDLVVEAASDEAAANEDNVVNLQFHEQKTDASRRLRS